MTATVSRRTALSIALLTGAGLVTAACGAPSGSPADDHGDASVDDHGDTAITHIHGLARDPKSDRVVIATHQGLFSLEEDGWSGGGQAIDLMGFAIAPDGSYLGSGHPGPGVDLPQPAGLVHSTDRGRTWQTLSRGGESDFHALTAGPDFVMGFDGTLRVTTDRKTWSDVAIPAPPHSLAAAPGTGTVLATTERGLLASSDRGRTWEQLAPPELLIVVAWADDRTIVGAGVDGRLHTTRDGGATWSTGSTRIGQVVAVGASVTPDNTVETLMVVGTQVLRSLDGGTTTEELG